jgi:histidinol phosphatase-like PHP family hydrolase
MSKPLKAALIGLLMITASAIFMWDSNAIASKSAQASEKPKPTQAQVTDLANYHVHLTRSFSVTQAAKLSKASGIKFGILEHPYRIPDDRALEKYIKMLEPHPVYKGLQPLYTNWARAYSKEMLAKLDYVLMDAMTMPNKDGTWTRIGRPNIVVEDPQDFMKRYVDFSLYVINNEPIDIFGWPTVLPKCIADQYDELWTNDRMQKIITAAIKKKIAIEINEKAKVPSARFIKMAKSAGAKFTFGSDSSGPDAARLDYCLKMVELCGLTDKDMFKLESRAKAGAKAAETPTSTTVQVAVEGFNAEARTHHVGKSQPPLTEAEVIAAIRGWIPKTTPGVTDDVYNRFQDIAESRVLPEGARLSHCSSWGPYRGFDFKVWWIDLSIKTSETGGYTFRIRDQKISSRKL